MQEEPESIHYKKLVGKPTHAGVYILPDGKDIEYIIIDHFEKRSKELVNGKVKDCTVAIFKPNPYTDLPWVINVVNAERILKTAKLGATKLLFVKDLPIRLTQEDTSLGPGLRISKLPAKQPSKPTLDTKHLNWNKCIDYLKQGNTVQDLRKGYEISEEVEKLLNNEVKK